MSLPACLVSTSKTMKTLKMSQARKRFWLMWPDWTGLDWTALDWVCVCVPCFFFLFLQQLVSNKMSAVIIVILVNIIDWQPLICQQSIGCITESGRTVSRKAKAETFEYKLQFWSFNSSCKLRFFFLINLFHFAFVLTSNSAHWGCQSKVPLPVTSPALFDFLWWPKINSVIHLTRRRRHRRRRHCVEFVTLWAKSFG